MVVCGLTLNGGDKSVWPDPVSPCYIFTVSQGTAVTVTAHPARDRIEKGAGGESKMGGRKK